MRGDFQDAFARLQGDANRMSGKLDVSDYASNLDQCAGELDGASQELARRTESSAAGLAETSIAVEAFAKTDKSLAESSTDHATSAACLNVARDLRRA